MITAVNFRSVYNGNGAATTFPFGFPVADKTFVLVTETDLTTNLETTLVADVDYTVNGVSDVNPADWTITLPVSGSPLPTGKSITITPNLPLKQLIDFANQGNYYPQTTEDAVDYLTVVCQELQEQLNRTISISVGDNSSTTDPDQFLQSLYNQVALATAQAVAAGTSATAAAASVVSAAAQATSAATSAAAAAASAASIQPFDSNQYAVGSGTNTITASLSPTIASLATGGVYAVKIVAVNTGAATLNLNGLGASPIQLNGNALVGSEMAVGQIAEFRYDGVNFQLLNPTPVIVLPAYPPVRQTVLGGPDDTNGLPTFLPSTAVALSLTSQNITSGSPFVVSSANGFGAAAVINRIGFSITNLTWGALSASSTNYLYVDVAANGSLTPGSTTLAPVYQPGGTRSTTSGQFTFNITEMFASVGNGSAAVQAYRVFVGEAVTSGTAVTSAVAYVYQGYYLSGYTATLPTASTKTSKNHNIGDNHLAFQFRIKCLTTELGYAVGDIVTIFGMANGAANVTCPTPLMTTYKTAYLVTASSTPFVVINQSSFGYGGVTSANWAWEMEVKRTW